MARIPYAAETGSPEITALAAQIRAERDGKVPNIYRMLLNSPDIARKEGMSDAQFAAISGWEHETVFDDADRAVLAYTDAMTKEVHVPDAVFAAVKKHFDPRKITELTATVAAYNMVSRFLEAMQIDPEQH